MRWRATSSRWRVGMLSVQSDVQYTDKFCFTVLCAPVEHEDSYTVDQRARRLWRRRTGAGRSRRSSTICANEKYRVYAFDSSLFAGVVAGVYAKPRTYGVTATYRIGAAVV